MFKTSARSFENLYFKFSGPCFEFRVSCFQFGFHPGSFHAFIKDMKKFLVILILVGVAIYYFRHAAHPPDNNATALPAQSNSDGSDYFKRPLDRTHEVIDQVKKQRREDNY